MENNLRCGTERIQSFNSILPMSFSFLVLCVFDLNKDLLEEKCFRKSADLHPNTNQTDVFALRRLTDLTRVFYLLVSGDYFRGQVHSKIRDKKNQRSRLTL